MNRSAEAARQLVRELRAAGHEAYWAGGSVRDRLLGRVAKDHDIATSARPQEVSRLFPGSRSIGAHFGVVLVHREGVAIEVATFRVDGDYSDGRHPDDVRFATAREDAERRDFTVNGLFYDPIEDRTIDYVGGRRDLERRTLRAIGDPERRFAEDRLRLLRAIRFATVLDFEIEPATWRALVAAAPHVPVVSAERIQDELSKILASARRGRGFDLLAESGLLDVIVPEFAPLRGCEQPPEWHPEGDVFVHTRLLLEHLPEDASLSLVWAALLHDIGKPPTQTYDAAAERIRFNGHDQLGAEMTEEILGRLRYPNDLRADVAEMVRRHMHFAGVKNMRRATLRRFMARPTFDDELLLHYADCSASHGMLDLYDFLVERQREFADEPLIPEPLVTGRDLIARGWSPGPAIGAALRQLQTLQLEGTISTRAEALAALAEISEALLDAG